MNKTATTEKLLTAQAVGEMLSLSKRQIFRLNSCGQNLKDQLGELLLYLLFASDEMNRQQKKKCWQVFDLTLRKYLDLKYEGQNTESQKSDKKVLE